MQSRAFVGAQRGVGLLESSRRHDHAAGYDASPEALAAGGRAPEDAPASLDYVETLAAVAELALRSLADFCVVDVIEGDAMRRLHVAHADPEQAALARELLSFPLDRSKPHLSWKALETRRPVLVPEVTERMLDSFSQGESHRALIRAIQPRSVISIPLLARGRLLGAILYISSKRSYGAADLAHAEKLARLAAIELDNARLYNEAQRALEARDRVLGVVAHDLRNPLNVISVAGGMLLEPTFPPHKREQQIRMILSSAHRMDRLIGDLLDVAKIEADRLFVQRAIVDPVALVREAVDINASLAVEKGVDLRADPDTDLPPVHADRDRIIQVLSNLIGNAIKFTPAAGRIVVAAQPDGRFCRFIVTDTGPGIPPDQLPHLFDAFWQAERGSVEGAGLGLAIARGIVDAHHGRVWAESTPGRGSSFFFTIPCGEEQAGTAHAADPS